MKKRVITGVLLLAAVFALMFLQGWYLKLGFLAAALLCVHEAYAAFKSSGGNPARIPGFAFVIIAFIKECCADALPWVSSISTMDILIACVIFAFILLIIRNRADFADMCSSFVPLIYPGAMFVPMFRIGALESYGVKLLLILLAIICSAMNDTFALFSGKFFGKHRLITGISPKKTVEGAIGGMAASILFAAVLPVCLTALNERFGFYEPFGLPPVWVFIIFGFVNGVLSDFGDLAASYLKRCCGIKDFGKIFPGHGGMLDRCDALLFSFFVTYLFFKHFVL